MVREDTTDELWDMLEDVLGLNLNEVMSQADVSDNTKLVVDNGVDVCQQPTEMIPLTSRQPLLESWIDPDNQPPSPEFLVPQPTAYDNVFDISKRVVKNKALSPAPVPQQVLSPEPCNIQVEPFGVQQLDLPQLSASLESLSAPSMPSSLSVGQQKEETASPAPQETVNAPEKRGRKRKYPEGVTPSRRRPRKSRVYELKPQDDKEMEKKRKAAVRSKKNREQQKETQQNLCTELAQATAECDRLQQVVKGYELREQQYKLREQQYKLREQQYKLLEQQFKLREQQLLQVLSHNIKTEGLHHTLGGL